MSSKPTALLVLADGTVFEGTSVGASGHCVGELVFNTSMTGYQEVMTDPSYAQQIVMFTTAHVGNTGCNDQDMESTRAWASGLVMRDYSDHHSNYRAEGSLSDWLKKNNVVAIADLDTRHLTQRLRDQGAIGACIIEGSKGSPQHDQALQFARSFSGLEGMDLAKVVSREAIEDWTAGRGEWATSSTPSRFNVVAYDFGIKQTILRILHDLGCRITVVPAQTPAAMVLAMNPDGIFLSNGPGDPSACDYAIKATEAFLQSGRPIFGICLGFQILALACGAKSTKMKFGHHGANHPVLEVGNENRVFITSQNHGFAIEEASLPNCLRVTHRSLFDNSLQGIMHAEKPAFGFQGHPEASPGPHDIDVLFNQFIEYMSAYQLSVQE